MTRIVAILTFVMACSALGYVEYPKDCLSSNEGVCHFGTVKKNSTYKIENMQFFLGKEALLRKENNSVEWVSGPVLLEIEAKSQIKFKGFQVNLEKGSYLLFGDEGNLKVDVLEGHFQVEKFEITEGFQASFSVNVFELELEPLQAIDLKEHLVRYVNTKNLNREQAKEYIEEFGPKHKNYLAWVEELNKNLIKRSIARDDAARRRERQAKEKARLEQEKRKLAFFNKVFER
jgi:hypothetical protein